MAIEYEREIISSGYNLSKINNNFAKIEDALVDGLSRSGEGPNHMEADLDMNSNDILNVNEIDVQSLKIANHSVGIEDTPLIILDEVTELRDEVVELVDSVENKLLPFWINSFSDLANVTPDDVPIDGRVRTVIGGFIYRRLDNASPNAHLDYGGTGGCAWHVEAIDGVMHAEAFGFSFASGLTRTMTGAQLQAAIDGAIKTRNRNVAVQGGAAHNGSVTLKCSSQVEVSDTVYLADGARGGKTYGLNVDFSECYMYAVTGGNLNADNPVFSVTASLSNIKMPYVDGKRIASCIEILDATTNNFYSPRAVRPIKENGYSIKYTGYCGNSTTWDIGAWELLNTDAGFDDWANFGADAIVIDSGDMTFFGGYAAWAKRCIVFTSGAFFNKWFGCHPFNGGPGGPTDEDPIIVESFSPSWNYLSGWYFDNGIVIDHGAHIVIEGGYYYIATANVVLNHPYIRVKCTATQNNQSPNVSNIRNVKNASIGFLADDTNTYNWAGDWSNVDNATQVSPGVVSSTVKQNRTMYMTTSSSVASEHYYKPGGVFLEEYHSGTSNVFSQFIDPNNNTMRVRGGGAGNLTTFLIGEGSNGIAQLSSNIISLQTNGTYRWQLTAAGTWAPVTDNANSLGASSLRPSVIFAATGTINTSDAREKQQVRELNDAENAVAIKLKGLLRAFKFNEAVDKKGDDARIHFGVLAQDVADAFISEGLDPHKYAMFCYDEWEAQEAVYDHKNEIVSPAIAAGNRYGVRYEQLLAFIISTL